MNDFPDPKCNCWGQLEPECDGCKRMRDKFMRLEWALAMNKYRKHLRKKRK